MIKTTEQELKKLNTIDNPKAARMRDASIDSCI